MRKESLKQLVKKVKPLITQAKENVKDGIDDDDYETFLRWYGEWLHKELWQLMWVERSREMAKMMKGFGNSKLI